MQLARAEETLLGDILSDLFGYHLVVLDPPCKPDALGASRIMHRVLQTREAEGLADAPALIAQAEALPFQSDSIDAFVLPHVLEVTADKHQVLREVDRCLVGEGHVVILGFNPFGWWGLRRLISGSRARVPWSLPLVGMSRVKDWLSLLGFDIVHTQYFFPYPPWQYGSEHSNWKLLQRLHHERWPLFAAAYVLVARKRLTTLTPIKPRWRHRRGILPGMAEPHQGRVSSNE
ncbi:MAG: methyltransferase domain-containing protein [Thiogranum sp.]|nr:methyltransferase domain-containing protein [Thiogranum sp.]